MGGGCAVRVKCSKVIHCVCFCGEALVEVEGNAFGQAAKVVVVEVAIVNSCFGNASGRVW